MTPPPEQGGVLRMVVFVVDGARYAVSLSAAERVLPMVALSPVPGAPHVVLGAINLEGRVVPVVDLRRRLGLPPRDYSVNSHLLVVRTPRRTLAVPADEALGVAEIEAGSVTATEAVLPGLGAVKGIAALPEGLLFIYDLEAFLTTDEDVALGRALREAER